jgi:hypothetical protein
VSELPPESLSYETVVSEYFLGLRGAGLMLAPLEVELVRSWERRGLPVAVVCRGLRRGLEEARRDRASGSPPPRSMRAYRFAVEDEWRAYRAGRVGDAPPAPEESRVCRERLAAAHAFLQAAAARSAGPTREAHLAASQLLPAPEMACNLAAVDDALEVADAALLRAWLAALPRRARGSLGPPCRRRAGPRPSSTSRSAYRSSLRAHLLDLAREAGLLCLRGSV